MCNNLEELHEYIDPGQLTEDLGGLIPYDHERWMEQRMVRASLFEKKKVIITRECHSVSFLFKGKIRT